MRKLLINNILIILFLLVTSPAFGQWTEIPNSAIFPAMPLEMSTCPTNVACQPELWSPLSAFAYSGGDLYKWNGVWGFLMWGGGHAATADNSLYWTPFDGSGPKRLTGPYLAPDGIYNNTEPDVETYPNRSRNQDTLVAPGFAPKSRHTYASILTVKKNGKDYLWVYGGSLHTGGGSGTGVTRMFDLSQTYTQAMSRPDMGWQKVATAPTGSVTSESAYDTVKNRIVTRGAHSLMLYDIDTDTWENKTPSNYDGCCDYAAGVAIDVVGRKMYVVGNRIAEMYDIDTFTLTNLALTTQWGAKFSVPYWMTDGYGEGSSLSWHERTKQILFIGRHGIPPNYITTTAPEFWLIDPATNIIKQLSVVTDKFVDNDLPYYSRARIIPNTDQIVIVRTPFDPTLIGTLDFGGGSIPIFPIAPKAPININVTSVASVASPPIASFKAIYLGVDVDKVGQPNNLNPDGVADNHISFSGVNKNVIKITVDALPAIDGKWENPYNNLNWNLLAVPSITSPTDIWFSWYKSTLSFNVTLTYIDGTSQTVTTTTSLTVAPSPIITPIPLPPVPPTPTPPILGFISVVPGQTIPVRQWVYRPLPYNSLCNYANDGIGAPAELCGLGGSKHFRQFYHPGLKGTVIAGGDRPIGGPGHPGYNDGTGSEVILLDALNDKWKTLRPFCVTGEVQPGRPDNVVWAFDEKRNRALMAPGFYFITQAQGSTNPSGCGAIEGYGSYILDFNTGKWIGPNPVNFPSPDIGWGGDEGGDWGVVDPIKDELLRLYNGVGLQRLNLATNIWSVTPVNVTSPHRKQPVLDVQGRALYIQQPYGTPTDPTPQLVKIYLDKQQQDSIPLPWMFIPYDGETYMAFDSINRVLLVVDNLSMGGTINGVGFYHVDTGVWEWEYTPEQLGGAGWSFDENIGAFVGTGSRTGAAGYFIYKYGGSIKPLPIKPPPPPVATIVVASESFDQVDNIILGPNQHWTQVEGSLRTFNNSLTFGSEYTWSSARAEIDLGTSDMEVWIDSSWLEASGGYKIKPQAGVAARFNATSATYYSATIQGSDGYYIELYKTVSGVQTKLGELYITDYIGGGELRLRVTGSGPSVKLTVLYRGSIRINYDDNTLDRIINGTKAGVVMLGYGFTINPISGGYRLFFDNWKAGVAVVP